MSGELADELDAAGVEVELLLIDDKYPFILSPLSSLENVQSLAAIEAILSAHT